jgi:hypothetical protein
MQEQWKGLRPKGPIDEAQGCKGESCALEEVKVRLWKKSSKSHGRTRIA